MHLRAFRMIHVDPKDFSKKVVDVLGPIVWVVASPTISCRNVEEVIGTKLDHAAVVIREGMRNNKMDYFRARIRGVRIARHDSILRNHSCTICLSGVVHKEPAVHSVLRMKRQSEQPLFASTENAHADIEENRRR